MSGMITDLAVRIDRPHAGAGFRPGSAGTPVATRFLAAVAEHGGRPGPPGDDDTVCASFPTAAGALGALCSLAEGLSAQAVPLGWVLRAAMGVGYRGLARLLDVAWPGELLIPGGADGPMGAALPADAVLEPLAPQRLAGLESDEPVFRLSLPYLLGRGRRDEAAAGPDLLARYESRFIGRKSDLAAVAGLITSHRPGVVLVGPPGAGKTRLALEAAQAVRPFFAGNIFVADLSGLFDPAMLPQVAAAQLGVREVPGQELMATLTERLQGERALLVLDNCEQIAAACAAFATALTSACSDLHLVATSQVPLPLDGAQIYRLGGLSLPVAPAAADPVALLQSEAVRLFVDRALTIDPHLTVTAAETEALTAICACLDGLPLAIELAAERMRVLSLRQIAARLAGRFPLLVPGEGRTLARHDTLRTALDWYHDLLDPAEQVLWRRLSVFAGPSSLAAIETVCADEPGEAGTISGRPILDLVTGLVERSIMTVAVIGGEKYFRLLESIRLYGADRLAAAGEAAHVHARLRDHYDDLVARLSDARALFGPGQGDLMATLEATYPNLRTALRWSLETGEREVATRTAVGLIRFWHGRGQLTEGRYWLDLVLQVDAPASEQRARALWGYGTFAFQQGAMAVAEQRLRESIATAREVGDRRGMARALNVLAALTGVKGDDDECRSAYDQCLALFRELGDRKALGSVLNDAALLPKLQGDYEIARALFTESLAIQRETGNLAGAALALIHLADIARAQGAAAEARSTYEESLVLAKAAGDSRVLARGLMDVGEVHAAAGEVDQAAACLEEAHRLFREQGSQHGQVRALRGLAWLSRLRGNLSQGEEQLTRATALAAGLHDGLLVVELLEEYAWLAAAQGQWQRAVRLFAAAVAQRSKLRRPLPPSRDRAVKERLAQVKSILGPGVFRSVWVEGEQLQSLAALTHRPMPEPSAPVRRRGRPRTEGAPGGLTPREEEVVRLLAAGATSQEIANRLFLSRRTVEKYEEKIRMKLDVPNRGALAAWAAAHLR